MATEISYIAYLLEQLDGVENITYKKMFGEYMVFLNAKPVLIVCDNTVMIKKHEFLAGKDLPEQAPYQGAKLHYVLDPDDGELLRYAVREAEKITPAPKPKKKK